MDLKTFNNCVSNIPVGNEIEYLYNIFPSGVKIIEETKGSRIMLCTYSRNCQFKYAGVIIENNKVVSVSNKPPMSQYNRKMIAENFKDSVVYSANDGTTITLYYWNNKWIISSHRGYDISNYTRLSLGGKEASKTYKECLDEVLSKYNFTYDNLDKNKCYTLGFRHPELQPFDGDNMSAWFIQSVDLKKYNRGDSNYITTSSPLLPNQTPLNINLDDIFKKSKNSYANYCEKGIINYGYIIKNNSKMYIIESSLLSKIRKTFYSTKFNKFPKNNRVFHIILYFFLDAKYYNIFKKLFPQYLPLFNKIEEKINILIKQISNLEEKNNTAITLSKEISKDLTLKKYSKHKRYYLVSRFIYNLSRKPLLYQYLENNGVWKEL